MIGTENDYWTAAEILEYIERVRRRTFWQRLIGSPEPFHVRVWAAEFGYITAPIDDVLNVLKGSRPGRRIYVCGADDWHITLGPHLYPGDH